MKSSRLFRSILLMGSMVILSSVANAQSEVINKFFAKYNEDERFTSVFVSGRMFSMFSEVAEEQSQEMKKMMNDLKGLRILSSEKIDGTRLYKEAFADFNRSGYEELLKISGEEELIFLIKEEAGQINELLMLTGNQQKFFLMSIVGKIDLKTLSKLAGSMNIQGMENLEKLENNNEN